MLQKKIFLTVFSTLIVMLSSMDVSLAKTNIKTQAESISAEIISEQSSTPSLDDLDILDLDDAAIDGMLKAIDENKPESEGMSLQEKLKLGLTYIKIKSLEAKEQSLLHLKEHKSKYLVALTVTAALLATFFMIKMLIKEKEQEICVLIELYGDE